MSHNEATEHFSTFFFCVVPPCKINQSVKLRKLGMDNGKSVSYEY